MPPAPTKKGQSMKLYEINAQIEAILSMIEPDKNGVIDDTYMDKLAALDCDRTRKLEDLCKYVLGMKAEAKALKEEADRLDARRKVLENKQKSVIRYLELATNGEPTDCGTASIRYRTGKRLEVTDAAAAAEWLEDNGCGDLVTYPAPKISANDVKAMLSAGAEVPGCHIETTRTCSVR